MEILSETIKKVVNMEVDFKNEEYAGLHKYEMDNIPEALRGVVWVKSGLVMVWIGCGQRGIEFS